MSGRTITIGGEERVVPPINTRKLTVGTTIWARLQGHVNDALLEVARFANEWGKLNRMAVTRGTNERDGLGFTEEDFAAAGGPYIELPASPGFVEQMAVGFSYVYGEAEDDVARLCALVLATRQEVREHRKAGDLDPWLLDVGQDLIDDAEPDEMIELLIAVITEFRQQDKLTSAVGKLRTAWTSGSREDRDARSDSSTETERRRTDVVVAEVREEKPAEEKPATETNSPGSSSTGSPEPTDGPPTTSSTSSTSETQSPTPS